jgi:hypothetical protein
MPKTSRARAERAQDMGVTGAAAAVDTRPVDAATAAAVEAAEARAWADLIAAAPGGYAARLGLGSCRVGGALVIRCRGGGFDRGLFNRAIGLGVVAPATRAAVDAIVAGFRDAGVRRFMLLAQPHCRPAGYPGWLTDHGLRPSGAWDRVVRGAAPLAAGAAGPARELEIRSVETATADLWADFLSSVYGLDAAPWLRALHGRPGWTHRLAYEDGRPVGARSMFLPGPGELAFLAVDGPVPGVMTSDHAPDAAICRALVADGLARGAAGFAADIEAPSAAMDTPAYAIFSRLGFRVPYTRTHHTAV